MKKVISKTSILFISLLTSLILTGCTKNLSNVIAEIKYYDDPALEIAAMKNSKEIDTIKAEAALDICALSLSINYDKKYFSSDEDYYLYYSKKFKRYLAIEDIIVLAGEDYYKIIEFEDPNSKKDNEDKNKKNSSEENNEVKIINKYYVNSLSKKMYTDSNKPTKTKAIVDNGLGLKVYFPEKYYNMISLDYKLDENIMVEKKKTKVNEIVFNLLEDDEISEIFTIYAFDKAYDIKDFKVSSANCEAYFLGKNDKYSFCLKYKTNAKSNKVKEITKNDIKYILNNIVIY